MENMDARKRQYPFFTYSVFSVFFFLLLSLIISVFFSHPVIKAEVCYLKYQGGGNYLIVEALDDDLFHFEYGRGSYPSSISSIDTTPMIYKTDYNGPQEFSSSPQGAIETKDIKLNININDLYITLLDKTKNNVLLTTIMPLNLDQDWKGLISTRSGDLDVYGLGQQFSEPGNSNIDWDNRVREGGPFGNVMESFNGGANGNTQIPVLFAVKGTTYENYALFLDNKYKQRWDFTGSSQWKVEMFGDQIRFYVMTGPDLPDLRRDYMELVGHPLVPPRKMFGLWVSEYGYDNWAEMEGKLATLRSKGFPVDGFVLDLQWFGGITQCSDNTRMGSLSWDMANFPNPAQKITTLKNDQGIGIMLIEEAYIGKNLQEFTDLKNQGCLVKERAGSNNPAYLNGACTHNCWWGNGGMLDYTNDDCGSYWHDRKRQPLINSGIIGHWTDLGEPELYPALFCQDTGSYAVGTEADAHNIFNLKWIQSIYTGYSSNNIRQRPFMMSRSGTAGIQRFGAAMWSGDIASRLTSLATHCGNQAQMSFSGIDYYSADIGGFHRNLEGDLDEMYTQWYGYGMMFDIPGRSHTENLCNCKETAPDRIGDITSNLENTRMRYELIPYVYSLAHHAYRFGDPLMPPPVFYYQTDDNLRNLGHEKMIGSSLLAAIVAKHGETERDVYLPAGTWIDWHTNERISSRGVWLPKVQLYRSGIFRPPLYAKEGSIVPLMFVDDKTMNAMGKRSDGSTHNELIAKVFAFYSDAASEFVLYEDDGETIAYKEGKVRATKISQKREGKKVIVTIYPCDGTYDAAASARNNEIRLITDNPAKDVLLNNKKLTKYQTLENYNAADSGWVDSGNNTIMAKSGIRPVDASKAFVFTLGDPPACTSEYSSISIPGAGNNWNPADPQRSLTRENCEGKIWKGRIQMSAEEYKFAANGSWKINWGSDGKQDGPNFRPLKDAGIYEVTFDENNPVNPVFKLLEPVTNPVSVKFICENGYTTFGISVYVVGNIPELGNWDPANAVKLNPDGPYPKWTLLITNLPGDKPIEWKCIKRMESGGSNVIQWEHGENNRFTTPASGYAGEQYGAF